MTNKKLTELNADNVANDRVKAIIRKVKQASNNLVYVYQWNIGTGRQAKPAPLGLFIDPAHIDVACDAVERYGGSRNNIKDGVQFDMDDACGVPGNHLIVPVEF